MEKYIDITDGLHLLGDETGKNIYSPSLAQFRLSLAHWGDWIERDELWRVLIATSPTLLQRQISKDHFIDWKDATPPEAIKHFVKVAGILNLDWRTFGTPLILQGQLFYRLLIDPRYRRNSSQGAIPPLAEAWRNLIGNSKNAYPELFDDEPFSHLEHYKDLLSQERAFQETCSKLSHKLRKSSNGPIWAIVALETASRRWNLPHTNNEPVEAVNVNILFAWDEFPVGLIPAMVLPLHLGARGAVQNEEMLRPFNLSFITTLETRVQKWAGKDYRPFQHHEKRLNKNALTGASGSLTMLLSQLLSVGRPFGDRPEAMCPYAVMTATASEVDSSHGGVSAAVIKVSEKIVVAAESGYRAICVDEKNGNEAELALAKANFSIARWKIDSERPTPDILPDVLLVEVQGDIKKVAMRWRDADLVLPYDDPTGGHLLPRVFGRRGLPAAIATATVLLICLIAFGIYNYLAYALPHTQQFANATNLQGIPRGISPLKPDEAKKRWYHYKITTKGWYGPVEQVEILNAVSKPFLWRLHHAELAKTEERNLMEHGRKHEVRWVIDIKEGRHLSTTAFDVDSRLVWKKIFKDENEAEYYFDAESSSTDKNLDIDLPLRTQPPVSSQLRRRNYYQNRAGSDAEIVRFIWSPEGYCQAASYFSKTGQSVDATGKYGWKATLNNHGQPVEISNLDSDYKTLVTNTEGWAIARYIYSAAGDVKRVEFYDTKRKPIVTSFGFASSEWKYDQFGRQHIYNVFGVNGEPVTTNEGFSSLTRTYDANSFLKRESYFGINGQPIITTKGFHAVVQIHDKVGLVLEEKFLDVDELLTYNQDGWAIAKAKYDLEGNQTEASFFGVNEEPILNKDGVHLETRQYENGNITNTRHFGKKGIGNPVIIKQGYAHLRQSFNERGNRISQSFFGINNEPVTTSDGYHLLLQEYDPIRPLITKESYFDSKGKHSTNKHGEHAVIFEYDKNGNLTAQYYRDSKLKPILTDQAYSSISFKHDTARRIVEERIFGIDGKPVLGEEWEHGYRNEYDIRGNRTAKIFLGKDGEIANGKGGIAIAKRTYDSRGNPLSESLFDANQIPVNHSEGYHLWRAEYDSFGNKTRIEYFAKNGSRTYVKSGYSIQKYEYDIRGRQIARRFFDHNNNPTITTEGIHGWTNKYDDYGNHIEQTLIGLDDQPAIGNLGVAILKSSFDQFGREISRQYFGTDGSPVIHVGSQAHIINYTYDSKGNEIESKIIGFDEELQIGSNGYAIARATYDSRGNKILGAVFDSQEKPAINKKKGTHRWIATFNEQGQEVRRECFGPNNKRRACKEGYAIMVQEWGEQGQLKIKSYFDANDKPTPLLTGEYKVVYNYGPNGKPVEERYFGASNEPTYIRGSKVHLKRLAYDNHGNNTSIRFFDEFEQPSVNPKGAYGVIQRFDKWGRQTESQLIGLKDQILENGSGIAFEKITYDDYGKIIRREVFGANRDAAKYQNCHAHAQIFEYDKRGNQTRQIYVTKDGKATPNQNGYTEMRTSYDDRGNRTEESYYDAKGNRVVDRNGAAITKFSYDDIGNNTGQAYFGLKEEPTVYRKYGYHSWIAEYDQYGNQTENKLFDKEGNVTSKPLGYAIVRMTYDNLNRITSYSFFNEYDKPTKNPDGQHHRKELSYSLYGEVIEERFYGIDGKLMVTSPYGVSIRRSKFDNKSKKYEESYYGLYKQPLNVPKGFHLWRNEISKNGIKNTIYEDRFGRRLEFRVTTYITKIDTDSKESKAGLQTGDIIVLYDGVKGRRNNISYAILNAPKTKKTVSLTLFRRGQYITFDIPKDLLINVSLSEKEFYLPDINSNSRFVPKVLDVVPESQALRVGIKAGDIILSYDNVQGDMKSLIDQTKSTKNSKEKIIIRVLRNGKELKYEVKGGPIGIRIENVIHYELPSKEIKKAS